MGMTYGDPWDDLWGPQVCTRLRSHSYGVKLLLWDCGATSMGISADPMGHLWATVVAVPTLWGIYGLLRLRCRPYGGSMGCCCCGVGPMGFIYGPYGDLKCSRGCGPIAMGLVYGDKRSG